MQLEIQLETQLQLKKHSAAEKNDAILPCVPLLAICTANLLSPIVDHFVCFQSHLFQALKFADFLNR